MDKVRKKIIFLWNYLEWGGAQIYFLAIMKEARDDWDIVVVLPKRSSPEILRFIEQAGGRYEFLEHHFDSESADSIARKLQRQYRRIRVEVESFKHLMRYDLRQNILHIEIAPWQSWILLTALALRGANVFATLHNALPKVSVWRETIWKLRLQFVSRLPGFHVFTSNKDAKNKLRGLVDEKFWNHIRVTYTCVNPSEIDEVKMSSSKAEFRERFGISEDKFVVLCVGQFIDRKGRWVFLEAAKLTAAQDRDIQFVWLSPTPVTDEDRVRLDAYGLGDRFRFVLSETLGSTHMDVLRFFRIADVFALPSFVEGLPIALLEAMALEIPSISTNVYAIPEAVKHSETGMLIEAGDADALADAIIHLRQDEELRSRLAKNASDLVLRNFDERVASRTALAAYKECFRNAG